MSYYKKAHDKYFDHPLFKNCISISCPIGWLTYLDDIVSSIEAYNLKNKDKLTKISQVKIKYGRLTVYLFRTPGPLSNDLLLNVDDIVNKASDSCYICGRELIESVENSKIVWKCLDHYEDVQLKKITVRRTHE